MRPGNRTYKYRAYDTELKKWSTDFIGVSKNGGLMFYQGSEGYNVIPAAASRCKLVEWTGATDVNGKDIYEGDIIRDTSSDAVWTVFWNEEDSGWGSAKKYGEYHLVYSLQHCFEVIGSTVGDPKGRE
jgi:hypothetical protein